MDNRFMLVALLAVVASASGIDQQNFEAKLEESNTELHHGNPIGGIFVICIALCFYGCRSCCGHHDDIREHHETLIETHYTAPPAHHGVFVQGTQGYGQQQPGYPQQQAYGQQQPGYP